MSKTSKPTKAGKKDKTARAKERFQDMSPEELNAKTSEFVEQLFKLRMQKATGQLGNTTLIRFARKDLARVKTVQTQRLQAASLKERV
jgi:large subunit ribosomal protein L29